MLKDNRWFSDVPPNLLVELWLRGKHKFIRRYAHIMREGLKGECFYVIIRGSVRIHSSAGIEQIYEQGMSFGEAGLVLDAHVRQISATAVEPCTLLSLSTEDVEAVGVDLQDLREHVIVEFLKRIPFFKTLKLSKKKALAHIMKMRLLKGQEVIFNEGDAGDAMYVLMEGRVEMHRKFGDSEPVLVGETTIESETSWFGELALYNKEMRRATATASEPTKLLVVDQSNFKGFSEIVPKFTHMLRVNATAYEKINEQFSEMEQARASAEAARKLLTGLGGIWDAGASSDSDDEEGGDDWEDGAALEHMKKERERHEVELRRQSLIRLKGQPLVLSDKVAARFAVIREAIGFDVVKRRRFSIEETAKKRAEAIRLRQEHFLREVRAEADESNPHPLKQWQDKADASAPSLEVGHRPALLKAPEGALGVAVLGSGGGFAGEPTKVMRPSTPGKVHRAVRPAEACLLLDGASSSSAGDQWAEW